MYCGEFYYTYLYSHVQKAYQIAEIIKYHSKEFYDISKGALKYLGDRNSSFYNSYSHRY